MFCGFPQPLHKMPDITSNHGKIHPFHILSISLFAKYPTIQRYAVSAADVKYEYIINKLRFCLGYPQSV
jgi:hypothetical protein